MRKQIEWALSSKGSPYLTDEQVAELTQLMVCDESN